MLVFFINKRRKKFPTNDVCERKGQDYTQISEMKNEKANKCMLVDFICWLFHMTCDIYLPGKRYLW